MKNFIRSAFAIFILLVYFLISCKKEDEISSAEIITGTIWRITSFVEDGIEEPIEDCDADDKYIFKNDGLLYIDEGILDCGFPKDTTRWRLSEDGKTLFAGFGVEDEPWAILEINKQILKIQYTDTVDLDFEILTFKPF
ncbi:MAG: lipocalin family protein [Saprospiraceae bacterium]|nr:lipocalin family protein [Saprospiraceae bacterium]